jgi:quercetin dioxygenase-like cupin family protein
MREKLMWMLVGCAAVGASLYIGIAWATPASGFTSTTTAEGRLEGIEVSNHMTFPENAPSELKGKLWESLQQTRGPSDLYVQSNVWAPGGTTGWHTHPGHSLIIVTEGAVTAYDMHDPSCTPHVYKAGMAIVDAGGDHVHVLRNEGSVPARTTAVQLIPAGAPRRIDAQGPAGCPPP